MYRQLLRGLAGALVLVLSLLLGGCVPMPKPMPAALWVDVHPSGWVAFAGIKPPFPPPKKEGSSYDDKLMLFHPNLGIGITLLEDWKEFSWPHWWSDSNDRGTLYWVSDRRWLYRLEVHFREIERALFDPLESHITLPLSLKDAEELWSDEQRKEITAPAVSPDGRYLAYLRKHSDRQLEVVVLSLEQPKLSKVAELPTVQMFAIPWTPDGKAILLAREDKEAPAISRYEKIPIGMIVRHEIATGEEAILVRDVAMIYEGGGGIGPMALTPDGLTLYYTSLTTLRPRTQDEIRLGLYCVDVHSGARKLLMELPLGEGWANDLIVAPSGRRVAFTITSLQLGLSVAVPSTLYLIEGDHIKQLARVSNGRLFPSWVDDVHLAYVQFEAELNNENELPMGIQPALWLQNVETGERHNLLPTFFAQAQTELLRAALQQMSAELKAQQEKILALESTVQDLKAQIEALRRTPPKNSTTQTRPQTMSSRSEEVTKGAVQQDVSSKRNWPLEALVIGAAIFLIGILWLVARH